MEDVPPPLPLGTPLLLVKPPMGLATPDIFKALDLSQCSKADPRQLLQQMTEAGTMTQHMCVNDLERPAFERYQDCTRCCDLGCIALWDRLPSVSFRLQTFLLSFYSWEPGQDRASNWKL